VSSLYYPESKQDASDLARSTTSNPAETSSSSSDLKPQVDKLVAEGKKAIALKQWETGVAKYADALDLM
jgi:HAT1-interacting factor 1